MKRQKTIHGDEQSSLTRRALSIFVNQKQLSAKKDLDQREAEVVRQKHILDEAKRAAPVVFAKEGDLFTWECTDRYSTSDDYVKVIKYIGRNQTPPRYADNDKDCRWPKTPELGWLVFLVIEEGNIYEHMQAYEYDDLSYYNADNEEVPNTLCIPLEKCGILRVYNVTEDDNKLRKELSKPEYSYELATAAESQPMQLQSGSDIELSRTVLSVFGEEKQFAAQAALVKREKDLHIMNKQLEEAKKVAPALFANPGDLFKWGGGGSYYSDEVPDVVTYVGRNDIPPKQSKYEYFSYESDRPPGDGTKYRTSPPIGWLVFGNAGGYGNKISCTSLLDRVNAFPFGKYRLYDEDPDDDTPPEKCGAFEVYEHPKPDYWDY